MGLSEDLIALAQIKKDIDHLSTVKNEIEANIVDAMQQIGKKSISAQGVKGTLVEGTTVNIDEDALKKALGAKTWGKVTKQVLDKAKLEAAVVIGDVDEVVVAQCSEEKPRKPYIRVSGEVAVPNNSKGQPKPAAKKRVRPAGGAR